MIKHLALTALILTLPIATLQAEEKADGWKTLFDGKTFEGWKANEHKESWKIENGTFMAAGPRSHLFYVGDDKPFVNFELELEVLTRPKSNGGVYFHTQFQETGWPKYGYEAQVNATHRDPRKTGSLYAVENVMKAPHEDDKWFKYYIKVDGRRILIKVDGETTVDYTEPEDREAGKEFTRKLDKGTFAFQAHDPISVVKFRNIRVRRLP